MDASGLVDRLRTTFDRGVTRPLEWRLGQLAALQQLLVEEGGRFEEALRQDLGKAPAESQVTEIGFLVQELRHTRRHLRDWLRPQPEPVPWSRCRPEPRPCSSRSASRSSSPRGTTR